MWTRREEYVRIVAGGVLQFLLTPMGKRSQFIYVSIVAENATQLTRAGYLADVVWHIGLWIKITTIHSPDTARMRCRRPRRRNWKELDKTNEQ